jgi:hypothetical protein
MSDTPEIPEAVELALLLRAVCYDLHPTYSNTSRRGGGIGGQSMTPQCNYLDPSPPEIELIQKAEKALYLCLNRAVSAGVDLQRAQRQLLSSGGSEERT